MKPTAESIELESARVRSELVEAGSDLRHHADPAVLLGGAKAEFARRAGSAPSFLKRNATPIGIFVMGGTLGAALTGVLSRPATARLSSPMPGNAALSERRGSSETGGSVKTLRSRANAALLSGVGLALGYVAGMIVPSSPTEERLLAQPKALAGEYLNAFLEEHSKGMQMAVANALGISRYSAMLLMAVAVVAEAFGRPQQPMGPRA